MANFHLNLEDSIGISESVTARSESNYLIIKNKEICSSILRMPEPGENDLIDFFVSIHLVMEISLNTFFRVISLNEMQKRVDPLAVIKNLDGINFIDKTILFIYNSHFNFNGDVDSADRYHSIIGQLRQFSEPRNKLLHGHSISTIFHQDTNRHSDTRNIITRERMNSQISLYKSVMDGLKFYFDCLRSSFSVSGKDTIKREYLDDGFLNINSND